MLRKKQTRRSNLGRALGAALLVVSAMPVLASPAHAGLVGVSGVGPEHPFPVWYEDVNGTRLELCNNPDFCFMETPDPSQPMSFPDNFGPEAFWWMAETGEIPFEGGGRRGTAELVLAMEAAWANEEPVAAEAITFERWRLRVTGLVPGETYTVTHPFGVEEHVATDAFRSINVSRDIGCAATPCQFEDSSPATCRTS